MRAQLELFPDLNTSRTRRPVNVSSVPQRSPFRYPGGKTWFVPVFREWMRNSKQKNKILIEPFTGGGIISLTALFEGLAERAILVELDEDVASVWQTIVDGEAEWLAERILRFEITRESVMQEISVIPSSNRERAFQTILKNRTFHGGILAKGSGVLKHGENGKGIASRWYPATLARRLRSLQQIAGKIEFRCEDGLEVIREHSAHKNMFYFIDPPYTAGGKKAGKRLYRYCDIDHERLFDICSHVKGDFLMTYDNADEVKAFAEKYSFMTRTIPMNNTHHAEMEELVIGKDLSWMDRF
jgi:DNA adenine methylase